MSDTVKLHVTDRQGNTHEIEATIDPDQDDCKKFNVRSFWRLWWLCLCNAHVYVDEAYTDKLNTKDEDEADMLEMSPSKDQSQTWLPTSNC